MAEVWAEMQAQVEELTGQAGRQILRAILENEVTRRVGPPNRPNPTAGCVRWGKQSGYVVFGGQKIPLERLRAKQFLNWRLVSFFLCVRTSCARLRAAMSIYSGRNKRAHISIAVYLRLTRMDVCCGPPASL
jgi:hypothetical protein